MKKIVLGFLILFTTQLLAKKPDDIQINLTGIFDANRTWFATFTASGAFSEVGSALDTPSFVGQAVHISRLLTTSHGEYITIEINTTHIAGLHVAPPDWCAPPPTPEGTLLFFQTGNWKVIAGTGPYSLLKGNGDRAAWILFDAASFTPIAATECLIGGIQVDP